MVRLTSLCVTLVIALSACAPTPPSNQLGSDGKPLPSVYKIRDRDTSKIQFRMLDAVNALRGASGQQPVELDANLTAAAATHARDMSLQNRPWHFGSDGSSPIDRVQRSGFAGQLVGENISETFETELETLGAWMDQPDTRRIILSPDANRLGFSWFQEKNGKIWWTMVMGSTGFAAAFNS
ncbi:MAG: CAP domain-containing protein [Pseudomonadota bacterium]